jgi:hypothetical protein
LVLKLFYSFMMKPTLTYSPCLSALLCSALVSLTACGGGGSSSFDTSTLQGRWVAPDEAYTAIVVPGSANVATVWLLARDASRLAKLSVDGSQVVTGKSLPTALDGPPALDVTGTLAASLTTTPKSLALNNVLASATSVNQASDLAGMAVAADAAGTWKSTAGAGAVGVTWTLTDAGVVSGTSSTPCDYAGAYETPSTVNLYTLTFNETCAGTVTSFNGIATLNADKSRLTVVATDSAGTKGTAFFFTKQPK